MLGRPRPWDSVILRMAYMTVAVWPDVVGRSQIMSVIIRANIPRMGIYISAIGVVVRHCAIGAAAIVWLHICSIASVVTMYELVCRRRPCDGERDRKDAES